MLLPDVTEILDDPEVGGGVAFQVKRTVKTRKKNDLTPSEQTFNVTGNIQPSAKSIQASTPEDSDTEEIVVRARFAFQTGANDGLTFTDPDLIITPDGTWQVMRVESWKDWGFTTAYAAKVTG